jgi:hypothetical protein
MDHSEPGVVDQVTCLGSIISKNLTLNFEINQHVEDTATKLGSFVSSVGECPN